MSTTTMLKSAGLYNPRMQAMQQSGKRALSSAVANLFPLDIHGGRVWETAAFESWSTATRSVVGVSQVKCILFTHLIAYKCPYIFASYHMQLLEEGPGGVQELLSTLISHLPTDTGRTFKIVDVHTRPSVCGPHLKPDFVICLNR